jgi:hypothetical protein
VKVVAVHDDGRAEIEGHDLKLTLWYHDPDHLRSALCLGGGAEWRPKYHVLYVISGGSFNLATLDQVQPCKPPIRRRPTETTRQFIGRAMRENHGYTVPQYWLVDLDAIPDGDTGEPQSGYLVGVDTPTAQEAALLQNAYPNSDLRRDQAVVCDPSATPWHVRMNSIAGLMAARHAALSVASATSVCSMVRRSASRNWS